MKTMVPFAAVMFLVGCSGAPAENKAAAAPTAQSPCEALIDLAQVCYDSSDPDLTCEQVLEVSHRAGDNADLRPSQKAAFGKYCTAMCTARKNNVAWHDMRTSLSSACDG